MLERTKQFFYGKEEESKSPEYAKRLADAEVSDEEIPGIFRSNISFETLNNLYVPDSQPDHVLDIRDVENYHANYGKPEPEWENPFTRSPIKPISAIDEKKQKQRLENLEKQKKALDEKIKPIRQELDRLELKKRITQQLETFIKFKEDIHKLKTEIKAKEQALKEKTENLEKRIRNENSRKKYLSAFHLTYIKLPKLHQAKEDILLWKTHLADLLDNFMRFTIEILQQNSNHPQVEINEAGIVLKSSINLYRQLEKELKEEQTKILIKDATEILNEMEAAQIEEDKYHFNNSNEISTWLSQLDKEQFNKTKIEAEQTLAKNSVQRQSFKIKEIKIEEEDKVSLSSELDAKTITREKLALLKKEAEEKLEEIIKNSQTDIKEEDKNPPSAILISEKNKKLFLSSPNYSLLFAPATPATKTVIQLNDVETLDIESEEPEQSAKYF